ncbi:DMT family transporter [Qipengyuania sediminis]|uniref:DMT family transporter n=1 Tax=Qipengyuania sediminis TaxID=1532023 RepID=UPI001059F3B3|nr:DMT family transporter [Qipengyuania sediminis]
MRGANSLPILAALTGVALLSLMDAFMKDAALAIGALTAAWLRAVFGTALVLPLWLATGARRVPRDALALHLERGVVSCFMAVTFFFALTKLPLAETIAISFVAPLVTLYLARVLLGEAVTRAAVGGSLLGFAGTIVIVGDRLGSAGFDADTAWGLAAILLSSMLYAYNFIVMRRQSQVAGPVEVAVFHSGVAALLLALAAPFFFVRPDAGSAGYIAISAVLTVAGAMTLAWAYARAEAQKLVPMEYSGFLWASLFGWLFFREGVSPVTVFGTALIVAGCWIAARRQDTEQAVV